MTAREIVSGRGLDRWEHARLFALFNIAQADALIANQHWKYTYPFWRPVTAIRWANDGNPDTTSDPAWRPFLVTPPYPDYPCALPSATGAAAEVLRQFFGTDRVAFTRTFNAPAVPLPAPLTPLPVKAITRSFESLSNAVAEAKDARVYAGLHFREGCNAGARQGKQIAGFVVRHELESTRHGHSTRTEPAGFASPLPRRGGRGNRGATHDGDRLARSDRALSEAGERARQDRERGRGRDQGEHDRNGQRPNHRDGHGLQHVGAGPDAPRQRQHGQRGGERGHQDGPQPARDRSGRAPLRCSHLRPDDGPRDRASGFRSWPQCRRR